MRSPRNAALGILHILENSKLWQTQGKEAPCEGLSDYLWNETIQYHLKSLDTYFVQGIKTGKLNPTAFGGYMVQDSVYCYKAYGSIETAASRAQDDHLKAFLEARAESYKSYYEDLFGNWHIRDASGIDLGEACQTYADYEQSVASNSPAIYLIVAMIPCARLWPWLGQQIQKDNPVFGPYQKWFNDNFNPTSEGYKKLERVVNEAGKKGHININEALKVYKTCMGGEAAFFSSVENPE